MKKLFTLLTLALLSIGTAWGAVTYKEFASGVSYYPFTSDNATAAVTGNWMVSGYEMYTEKTGTINPANGETVTATSYPGIRVKNKVRMPTDAAIFI